MAATAAWLGQQQNTACSKCKCVYVQGSETRVDTQKTHLKTQQKNWQKTHPKFNPVSFLMLLMTKDFIIFKVLEKL